MKQLIKERRNIIIIIILCFTLISRLLFIFGTQKYEKTRDWESGQIARNVLNGKGYSAGPGWLAEENALTAHKPPLYPAFLISVYYLFPDEWNPIMPDDLAKKSHLTVQLIQSVFYVLIVYLTYLLAVKCFGLLSGLFAMLIMAINPVFFHLHLQIERNLFDIIFILLIPYIAIHLKDNITYKKTFYFGLILGLSLLNNPAFLILNGLIVLWVFYTLNIVELRSRLIKLVLTGIIIIGVIAPWTYRNYMVFGEIIPITSNGGLELWIGNHEGASGGLQDENLINTAELTPELEEAIKPLNELQRYNYLKSIGISYMKEYPGKAVMRRIYAFFYFWSGEFHFKKKLNLTHLILGYGGLITVLLAWFGLWKSYKEKWGPNSMFLLIFIGFCLVYVLTHGGSKYRDGLFPLLSIYIGNLIIAKNAYLHSLSKQLLT